MYLGQGKHVTAHLLACKCVSAYCVQGSVRGPAGDPWVKLIAARGSGPGADRALCGHGISDTASCLPGESREGLAVPRGGDPGRLLRGGDIRAGP